MQRFIGIILGGLTIWALLNIMDALSADTQPKYLLAIVIGMLVALLYPLGHRLLPCPARQRSTRRGDPGRGPAAAGRRAGQAESRLTAHRAARWVTLGDPARHPALRPSAPLRRRRLPSALARSDDLGRRRPDHPARHPARRCPDAWRRRHADGDADRRRAAAAPPVLAAGRRLARPRPGASPADDRRRPRPRRVDRQHPGRGGAWRPVDAAAVRRRFPERVARRRLRPVVEHAVRGGDAARPLCRGDGAPQREPVARVRRRTDARRSAGPAARCAARHAGRRLVVPRVGGLPAPHRVAGAAHRAGGGYDARAAPGRARVRPGRPDHASDTALGRHHQSLHLRGERPVHPLRHDHARGFAGALGLALGMGGSAR